MAVLSIRFGLERRPGCTVYELATTGMTCRLDMRNDLSGYGMDMGSFGRNGFCPTEDRGETVSGSSHANVVSTSYLDALGEGFSWGDTNYRLS